MMPALNVLLLGLICALSAVLSAGIDHSVLQISYVAWSPKSNVTLFFRSDQCVNCVLQPLNRVGCSRSTRIKNESCNEIVSGYSHEFCVGSKYRTTVYFINGAHVNNSLTFHFRENWEYEVNLQENRAQIPQATVVVRHSWQYPINPVALGFFSFIVFIIALAMYDKMLGNSSRTQTTESTTAGVSTRGSTTDGTRTPLLLEQTSSAGVGWGKKPSSVRLKSLDTFRGIALTIMIFVNYGGGGYWFFSHSAWNGVTIADLVFPWFVWIMGTSMYVSFMKNPTSSTQRGSCLTLQKVVKTAQRSSKLFLLGLFLNNCRDFKNFRIPGVLQLIAVAYFIVSCVFLLCHSTNPNPDTLLAMNGLHWKELLPVASIVAVKLGIEFGLQIPGCPTGYLGPGGISDEGKYANCTGGSHLLVDSALFGQSHIFQTPTCQNVYLTGPFDPEGTLNWLSGAVVAYLGLTTGRTMALHRTNYSHSLRAICKGSVQGVALLLISGLLCLYADIPVNKNLWSLSFVCLACGSANLIFLLLLYVIDSIACFDGSPLRYMGMNSILIYISHEVFQDYFPFSYKHDENSHLATMMSNVLGTCSWVFIAYVLYRKKIFFKI